VAATDASLKGGLDLLGVEVPMITFGIISGAVLTVLGALLITRLGLWGQLGLLTRPERPRTLLWFLPFAIYGLLPLTAGPDVATGTAAAAITFGVLIASWKLIVLALLLHTWLPRGPRTAAALAACLWGTMHLGGILIGGHPAPTLVLSLSYVFLSFAFVSIRLRTGLIAPLVACYSLFLTTAALALQNNGATNLVATVSDAIPPLASSVLLAGYGLLAWKRPSQPAARHIGLVQRHQLLGQ
jgi:hypothetical protein